MLGFVDQADPPAALAQALLQHSAQRWSRRAPPDRGSHGVGVDGGVDDDVTLRSSSGSFKLTSAREENLPIEVARLGRDRFDGQDRNPRRLFLQ
jgi:hypothetical protein